MCDCSIHEVDRYNLSDMLKSINPFVKLARKPDAGSFVNYANSLAKVYGVDKDVTITSKVVPVVDDCKTTLCQDGNALEKSLDSVIDCLVAQVDVFKSLKTVKALETIFGECETKKCNCCTQATITTTTTPPTTTTPTTTPTTTTTTPTTTTP